METEDIELELLSISDLKDLQEISRNTYLEAFSKGNTEENMRLYLDTAFSDEQLTKELEEENSEFYFAKYRKKVVGYIKINFGDAQGNLKEEDGMELERLYVDKKQQGKGVGRALLSNVIEIAQDENMKYLWLGVWQKNKEAVKFYQGSGFKIIDTHSFKMGNELQIDYLMRMDIEEP